jgi:hypothetical protein
MSPHDIIQKGKHRWAIIRRPERRTTQEAEEAARRELNRQKSRDQRHQTR